MGGDGALAAKSVAPPGVATRRVMRMSSFPAEIALARIASRLSSEPLERLPFQSGGSHPKFTRLREPEITRPCGAAVKDAIIAIGVIEGPRRRRDLADSAVGIAWGVG
jgi:hypothetical protein